MSSEFLGFPPLTSNFTPTPNVFFDYVLPNFPPCVISVVGAIIRATLGWTDSLTGEKRIEAELSVPHIARLSGQSENSVRKGIRQALEAGLLIETATPGLNTGARYALRWEDADRQAAAIEQTRRSRGDFPATNPPPSKFEGGQNLKGVPPSNFEGVLIKKGYVKKEKDIELKKSLIVSKTPSVALATPPTPELNPIQRSTSEGETDIYRAEVLDPVEEAISLTGDSKSRRRWVQLREICIERNATAAWIEAVAKTRQRLARGAVAAPGAYLQVTLLREMDKRGIVPPAGSDEERTDVRGAIGESLGLSTEDAGGCPPC